jgi:hypothetical protein
MAYFYLLFFFIPFMFQLFSSSKFWVITLNIMCLFDKIVLAFIKLVIMKQNGFKSYWKQNNNILDSLDILVYIVYFYYRMHFFQHVFPLVYMIDEIRDNVPGITPIVTTEMQDKDVMVFWCVFNTIVILFTSARILKYLRAKKMFSKLVKLIGNVIYDIMPFIIFFCFWFLLNSLLYRLAGVHLGKTIDYQNVSHNFALIIAQLRNSLGDMSAPNFEFWFTHPNEDGSFH